MQRHMSYTVVLVFSLLFWNANISSGFASSDPPAPGSLEAMQKDGTALGFCPLAHTDVRATVTGILSRVTVTQQFQNPFDVPIEAVYTFPLPHGAAVDDMTIRVGDRIIRGTIRERREAQAIYEQARAEGRIAALLNQERPNIFNQHVANILPGQGIDIVISYAETLKYENGSYQFVFPMVVGPRYIPGAAVGQTDGGWSPDTDQVPNASRITPPVVEEGERAGHDISVEVNLDAAVRFSNLRSTQHEIAIQMNDERSAFIRLVDKAVIPNKDFILTWDVAASELQDGLVTYRQGEDGFFLLILQPPERIEQSQVVPKELIFVLDTSGSMEGAPIEKAKQTMMLMLDGLYAQDTFNIITFSGDTRILFDDPVPATVKNLAAAQRFLKKRTGSGGTEMMDAIRAALEPSDSQQHLRIVVFMTDGMVGNDQEIIGEVRRHPNARVFSFGIGSSPNRFLLDGIAKEGRGAAEYVTLLDDETAIPQRFFERIRNPLLTDITLEWEGVPSMDILPREIPDVFSVQPVAICGRYNSGGAALVRLRGKMAGRDYVRELRIPLPSEDPNHDVLAKLWARERIKELSNAGYGNAAQGSSNPEIQKEITRLGLQYRLMTEYTSFVAVERKVVMDGSQPPRVQVPGKMPEGMNRNAVFGSTVDTAVMVTASADSMLLESSSSVDQVLPRSPVSELPLVSRNAMDLVRVMSGVVMADDAIFRANASTFAGVGADGVNIQRDGITVNDVRWPAGINAATRVNPDLVGEFRLVLAPVDAEIGRGNAQIQILTKSGTNEYHGSLVWNVQNTALDPNTWENNRNGAASPWRNMHQYTASVGGPVIKNKTFFFVLFDGQLNKIRTPYNTRVATPCARRGIFRFYDNWNNGNARTPPSWTGSTPVYPVVNPDGSAATLPALMPSMMNPDGSRKGNWQPHNGILRYASVYGALREGFVPDATCSNYNAATDLIAGTAWDANRSSEDTTDFIADFLRRMPEVNNYDIGDGLNTAGYRWSRSIKGADNLFGIGEDTYRRQINVRIDHNFSDKHRVNGTWSWEKSWGEDAFPNWPNGYGGKSIRRPQVASINLISSLRPTLLNEARVGMSRTGSNQYSPYTNPDSEEELRRILPSVNGEPLIIGPGAGVFNFGADDNSGAASGYFGTRGVNPYSGWDTSPRWTFGDTMSWTKGSHSLRFGGEYRLASSEAHNQWTGPFTGGYTSYPYAAGGETAAVQGINAANLASYGAITGSSTTGNISAMEDQLNFLSGSLSQVRQWRYINDSNDRTWNDAINDPALVRNTIQKEFSLFLKDDWRITPDLTLNLGVRYDYYGVPYLDNGLTTTLTGGSSHLFGLTGSSFSDWLKPMTRATVPSGEDSVLEFVGEGTANPDGRLYPRDWNNIGPAVGFSYQIPWLGRGKTTIRGGYQITYIGNSGRASAIQTAAGEAPGTTYSNNYTGGGTHLNIARVESEGLIPPPIPAGILPGLAKFPYTDRLQNMTVFDPGYATPYVQNITFAVTRNVTADLLVDLRYIGTLSRKTYSSFNINFANFITNGLLDAFDAARRGENPQLLDDMFMGQTIMPWFLGGKAVDGVSYHGGDALRDAAWANYGVAFGDPGAITNFNQMLAQGDYSGLANALNSYSGGQMEAGQAGRLIRANGFPENFIKANPQFNNANFETNDGHTNYHSFQAQVTLRPTRGVDFQSTYTWAKSLGIGGGLPYDPRDKWADYTLTGSDRRHNWVTFGNFALPLGPNKLFGKNSSGVLAHVIEGWQTSWITTVQSGAALNISARNGLYGAAVPDLVGTLDYSSIGVNWPDGAATGNYFGNRYYPGHDPQCDTVWAGGQALCNAGLMAVYDSRDNSIVFANPAPGKQGNFGYNRITGPMRWNVDLALSKLVQIDETKSFRLRVDMSNIFNHAQPSGSLGSSGTRIVFPTAPDVGINSGNFGNMPYKVGGRTFQLMARFDF